MNPTYRTGAANGCFLIKTTPVTGKTLDMLSVRENSVITVLNGYLESDPTTTVDLFPLLGMVATEPLFPGDFIVVPLNYKITEVTLTSGSVFAY